MDKIKQLLSNVSKEIGDVVTELDTLHQQHDSFSTRLDNLDNLYPRIDHVEDLCTRQLDINNSQISINDLSQRADNEFDFRLSIVEATVQSISVTMDKIIERLDRVPVDPVDPSNPDTTTPPTPKPVIPANSTVIVLEAVESSGFPRNNTLVSSGLSLGEDLRVKDIERLVLVELTLDDAGMVAEFNPIPADFRPTSWWGGEGDIDSIQWVQVSFLANLAPNETKMYWLVVVPEGDTTLINTHTYNGAYLDAIPSSPGSIYIDTGVAKFTLTPESILSSLIHDKKELISKGKTSCTFDGQTDMFSDLYVRRMEIEYLGPLVCHVIVETITSSLAIGVQSDGVKSARISTTRRYRFVAGSGLCTVENIIKWEGTKNGDNLHLKDGKTLNGVLGTLWQDSLTLTSSLTSSEEGLIIHDIGLDPIPGTNISLSQKLRESGRKQQRFYRVTKNNEEVIQGQAAIGGMVCVKSGTSIIVAALQNMDRNEPQGLSYNQSSASLTVQYANDKLWLAHRQGACVISMVGVIGEKDDLNGCWADLNLPVRIFAKDSSYYSTSNLVAVPSDNNSDYIFSLQTIINQTLIRTQLDGTYGLMTYAAWPRSWDGSYIEADYYPKGSKPADWQEFYLTGAFTDYYDVTTNAVFLALIEKDSRWLDLLSTPAALKMLFTQIIQTAPEDNWAYSSWASIGYGAYRSDKNSSHSYYRNLFMYYLLTGDRLVIDVLAKGEKIQLPSLNNQGLGGRFPHQRIRAIRFLAHCHYDKKERDFFRQQFILLMERCIRENYVEGVYSGKRIALWTDGKQITVAGVENRTPNLYAMSIWDLENLWWYGYYTKVAMDSPSHPWNMLALLVKTIQLYAPTLVSGDGSVNGLWSRAFKFNWDGINITDLAVKPENDGYKYLYQPWDICGMVGSWARAATITDDPEMIRMSRELVKHCIDTIAKHKPPMGKLSGLGTVTLAQAVAEEEKR